MKLQKISTWVKASEVPLPEGKEGEILNIRYGQYASPKAYDLRFVKGRWMWDDLNAPITEIQLSKTEWEYEQEAYILTKEEFEAEQWVSVKTKLPDYDELVLWYCADGLCHVESLDKDGNPWLFGDIEKGVWEVETAPATHWKRIVPPPENDNPCNQ